MFFKKSDYKKLKEELDEKLANVDTAGIFSLSRKELREKHQQLCTMRDEYEDRIKKFDTKSRLPIKKNILIGGMSLPVSVGILATAATSTVDLVFTGGFLTSVATLTGGSIIMSHGPFDTNKAEKLNAPLNAKIRLFEQALIHHRSYTKNCLVEKHTARKAFVSAKRKEKMRDLQQQKTAHTIQKKPIYKPKGQNNVL